MKNQKNTSNTLPKGTGKTDTASVSDTTLQRQQQDNERQEKGEDQNDEGGTEKSTAGQKEHNRQVTSVNRDQDEHPVRNVRNPQPLGYADGDEGF